MRWYEGISSACLVLLAELLHERLAVRGDRDGVLDARHRVADPDLDRPEPRVQADVPPDVRVVGDATRALELPDDRRVVRVVAEARRRARARERGEDHLPARCEPSRLAAPERRARRQREERREVREQPVHDLDRLLRVVDRDVHVHPEDELAPRDVLQLVDQRAVAVLRGDPLALEEAERMRARGADARALLARDLGDVPAERRQPAHHVAGVVAHGRRDLEHGLHELGVDPRLELVARDRGEHRLDVLDEIERLRVEELVLLLDAERVRVTRPELVVEDAAGRLGAVAAVMEGGNACFPVTVGPPRPRSRPSSAGRRDLRGRSCSRAERRRRPPRARARSRRSRPRPTR